MTAEVIGQIAVCVIVLFVLGVTVQHYWRQRPAVAWDPRHGRWRSARQIMRERRP